MQIVTSTILPNPEQQKLTEEVNKDEKSLTKQQPTGKVGLLSLSYFKSRALKTSLLSGLSTAVTANAIHYLDPKWNSAAVDASALAICAAGLAALFKAQMKQIVYEISLLYTILGRKDWWNQVDENIVLGALPLAQHLPELKRLGITHVVSLTEPFEMVKGMAQPVSPEEWKANEIEHKMIETADFHGVPAYKLQEFVNYATEILTQNPKALIYVHCKAGRGRSASAVIAYQIAKQIRLSPPDSTTNFKMLVDHQVQELKKSRPQINLNAKQKSTIEEFSSYFTKNLLDRHKCLAIC
jgi:atypical dual specificity phosphatase